MGTKPNPYGKTVTSEKAYAVYASADGTWVWRILKLNQRPDKARDNRYASALCAVSSPYTYDDWDVGNTYLNDIGRVHIAGPDILAECGRVTDGGIPTEA